MTYKVLVADDEAEIVEILDMYLSREGYEVIKAFHGKEALKTLLHQKVDIAILDIMMPQMTGIEVIRKIRESSSIPIICLSAKDQDYDKIIGLRIGADDYVVKPFNPLEMIARVEAQLRRYYKFDKPNQEEKRYHIGDIVLNSLEKTVSVRNQYVDFTSLEYKILSTFIKNLGRVLTKKQIYEICWGEDYCYDDNAVMVHISNIRNKIEKNPKKPAYIITVKGLGYRMNKEVNDDEV